jgi:hypothetical protein
MLVALVDKQRRAVSVVKAALLNHGLGLRPVCVTVDSWMDQYGRRENYAVFVQSGGNDEPFYVTGKTIVEAVRNMLISLKGRINDNGAKPDNQSEEAPF